MISQPIPTQKDIGFFGFGDMVPSFFLSPSKPGALIWGLGPVFQLPIAASLLLEASLEEQTENKPQSLFVSPTGESKSSLTSGSLR